MRPSPVRDLSVGLFVLMGLAAVGYLTIQVGGLSYKGPGGFELYAAFDEIGGLRARAPVSISGSSIGCSCWGSFCRSNNSVPKRCMSVQPLPRDLIFITL